MAPSRLLARSLACPFICPFVCSLLGASYPAVAAAALAVAGWEKSKAGPGAVAPPCRRRRPGLPHIRSPPARSASSYLAFLMRDAPLPPACLPASHFLPSTPLPSPPPPLP